MGVWGEFKHVEVSSVEIVDSNDGLAEEEEGGGADGVRGKACVRGAVKSEDLSGIGTQAFRIL